MILEVCRDGLWTLSFGLSQFHGHGSWLVCGVALRFDVDQLGDFLANERGALVATHLSQL
jgi:hypothetical protein